MYKLSRPPHRRSARELMTECPIQVPQTMSVRSAAGMLDAAGLKAAPVVDSGGRCVGVFAMGEYVRRPAGGPGAQTASDTRRAATNSPDEVRSHMTRRFEVPAHDADTDELQRQMRDGVVTIVVVLDPQRRPQGIVCGLDFLVNDSTAERRGCNETHG